MALPSGCRAVRVIVAAVFLLCLPPPAIGQVTYAYDALGRLTVVSTPEGVAIYEYDAVGNLLRITTRRQADVAGPVAILGMQPPRGAPGTTVTLYGRGFGATPAENQVAFNGLPAPIIAVSNGASIAPSLRLTSVLPPPAGPRWVRPRPQSRSGSAALGAGSPGGGR